MELRATSFARWRPGDGSPVVISLTVPRWLPEAAEWPRCWELCPRWRYFSAPDEEFAQQYLRQLAAYGPQRISKALLRIARTAFVEPSDRLCLICWEQTVTGPSDCHRQLFAEWLLVTTGEKVTEITP